MTWKFGILAIFLVALTLVLSTWRASQVITSERNVASQASLDNSVSLLSQMVAQKSNQLINQMSQFVYLRSAGPAASQLAQQALSSFEAIAMLTVTHNKSWGVKWVEKNPNENSLDLPVTYLAELFLNLPLANVDANTPFWLLLRDQKQQPVLALINFVQDKGNQTSMPALMVGLLHPRVLADALKSYSGTGSIAAVMDLRENILAESEPTDLGRILQRVHLKSEVAQIAGRNILALPVGHSNLIAVVLTPPVTRATIASVLARSAGIVFFVLVLSSLLVWAFGQWLASRVSDLILFARELALGQRAPVMRPPESQLGQLYDAIESLSAETTHAQMREQNAHEMRQKVFQQISASLVHELRDPAIAVLGHTHAVSQRSSETPVKSQAQLIEKEARKIKTVVDQLSRYGGVDPLPKDSVYLANVVEGALKARALNLAQNRISVQRNFQPAPRVKINAAQVQAALEEVVQNAIDAMKNQAKKELEVSIEPRGSHVELFISDSGEGVAAAHLNQIFDPFFSTRSGNHIGLGLSMARGIFNEQGAKCSLQSDPGSGTKWRIDFKTEVGIPADIPGATQVERSL